MDTDASRAHTRSLSNYPWTGRYRRSGSVAELHFPVFTTTEISRVDDVKYFNKLVRIVNIIKHVSLWIRYTA